ncbi:hypothetical protein V498_03373 [Pseudogymnoascus sp. VKM F-4517 (FW-2822)]|nr:hypothetical protein V498_03373 [Pseudogymnoascus sp. VKM F-4517 (FW-2822)]
MNVATFVSLDKWTSTPRAGAVQPREMDGLSVAAGIIAVVQIGGSVITYLSDVKDASQQCEQCQIETSNSNTLILRLKKLVSEAKSTEPWFTEIQALARKDGPLDQYRLALEALLAKIGPKSKLRKAMDVLLWTFVKDDIARVLLRMERVKTLVTIALELDHLKLSQAIKEDTAYVREALPVLQTTVVAVRDSIPHLQLDVTAIRHTQNLQLDAQKLQQHQAVMQWLSPSDFAAQQHDIISRKEESTGQWFLDSAQFHAWQHGPNKTLFCPGIPGAGKTMIAAIAIEHLCERARSEDVGIAYLFCNYKAQAEQTYAVLLATALKQLVHGRLDIAGPVTLMYENNQNHNTRPSLDEIFRTLQSACLAYSSVYLVVDALDECSDRDGARTRLIDRLRELQITTNVRLMFTSRFIPEIEEKFPSDPTLNIRASDLDLRRYIAGQVSRLPKCIQRSAELIRNVQDSITEAVDGMFLLAQLYVDSLLDKRTIQQAKNTLQTLRKGAQSLDRAYGEAIVRIEGQLPGDTSLAKKALSWITYAQKPLTAQELCCAIAIEPGETELNPDAVPDIDDILSVCAGLVMVDTERKIVRLVHYTTQEYFEETIESWNPTAQYQITVTCLTYLSFRSFESGSCHNDEEFERRHNEHVLLGYAAQNWGRHAQDVQKQVSEQALVLLAHKAFFSCAVQSMAVSIPKYKFRDYSQEFPKQMMSLHFTAKFGLAHLIEKLLQETTAKSEASGDYRDQDDRTPLSYAAENGHGAVVKLLVERNDVEADSKDKDDRTPLSYAAENGHIAVVKLLVERNDVVADSKPNFYSRTPLSYAAGNGHEAVVKQLVERNDIEADSKDRDVRTPLSYAAENGHGAVVKLLVERNDVEADSKDKNDRTPLSYAAENGHIAVVKLLVERNDVEADFKAQDDWTPLLFAAGNGHEAVVRLLLGYDAIVGGTNSHGDTPLAWSAYGGHKRVVQLLLKNGGIPDSRNKFGRTPLSYAAEHGSKEVVKLLLESGANPDSMGGGQYWGDGVVDCGYADNEFEEIIRLLLATGRVCPPEKLLCTLEDPEEPGGNPIWANQGQYWGRSPLSYAAGKGHLGVVTLLLELEAVDPNSRCSGRTPLSFAAENNSDTVVQLLLEKGGLPDIADYIGRTPLSYATENISLETVNLLLDVGVEPESRDYKGRTPACVTP